MCRCMRLHTGAYGHRKRVCTERWLWEKNPLQHRGIEPASAACRSDALLTELHSHLSLKPKKCSKFSTSPDAYTTNSMLSFSLEHNQKLHKSCCAWHFLIKKKVYLATTQHLNDSGQDSKKHNFQFYVSDTPVARNSVAVVKPRVAI